MTFIERFNFIIFTGCFFYIKKLQKFSMELPLNQKINIEIIFTSKNYPKTLMNKKLIKLHLATSTHGPPFSVF